MPSTKFLPEARRKISHRAQCLSAPGPGKDTVFMGLKIDSWGKWAALAIFSFFNTCINEFISNALDPWFLNSLQVTWDYWRSLLHASNGMIFASATAGPQDHHHRVLARNVPVDSPDPLHVRPCHGRVCSVPLLQPGRLCHHQASG